MNKIALILGVVVVGLLVGCSPPDFIGGEVVTTKSQINSDVSRESLIRTDGAVYSFLHTGNLNSPTVILPARFAEVGDTIKFTNGVLSAFPPSRNRE